MILRSNYAALAHPLLNPVPTNCYPNRMPFPLRISKLMAWISKNDTTNPRAIGRLNTRTKDIAQHLDESDDVPQ